MCVLQSVALTAFNLNLAGVRPYARIADIRPYMSVHRLVFLALEWMDEDQAAASVYDFYLSVLDDKIVPEVSRMAKIDCFCSPDVYQECQVPIFCMFAAHLGPRSSHGGPGSSFVAIHPEPAGQHVQSGHGCEP